MKKNKIFLALFLICFCAFAMNAQTLDEILQSHSEVMGFEKLMQVKTIIIEGESFFGERAMPFRTIIKKPSKYYTERDFMGRKMLQVLDGEIAWSTNPRDEGIRAITGLQLEMLKQTADYGGILMNWKEKGHKVSLEGTEDFEGTEVYKLKVEKGSGEITYLYLDSESYISLKETTDRKIQENVFKATVLYSNYKMIDGIAVAFNTETISDGQGGARGGRMMGGGTTVIKSIVFDQEVDDRIFKRSETK